MKKQTFFLLLFFNVTLALAQQDTTLIYARPGYEKDSSRANLKRNVVKKDSSWVLTLTDKKGTVQELITFADERLEVRQGPYARYQNGNLKMEGNYNRGYEVGEWKSYYPNKKIEETLSYIWGRRQGQYRRYWDNGQLKQEGSYEHNHKVGEWKLFLKNGKIASLATYNNEGEELDAEYFDQDGVKIKQPVRYPGGMQAFYKFLGKEIRYPKEAHEIQGVVKVSFIVKRDGSLASINVKESPSPILSKEAIRVVSKSTGWIPGTLLGEPVDMRIVVPIKFAFK